MYNWFKHFLKLFREINFKDSIDNLKECDILFFCHDVDRSISLYQRAYSPLIDSLRDDLEDRGFNCESVALPWSSLVGDKAHGNPICINRSIIYKNAIFRVLSRIGLYSFFKIESVYEKILKKSRAKLVISIGCPDDLCFSARLNKVFHVELLHGIGYTSIPWGWSDKETRFLPQGILALDDISNKTFRPLDSKGIHVKTIPHPFLNRFIGNELRKIPKEWLPKKNKSFSWKKEILISLQWGYAGDHGSFIEYENILKNGLFYEEIEQIVKENKDILFRFRFHPVQLKNKKYKKLIRFMDCFISKYSNTEWKESSLLPYPSIVRNCDGNISMSSMSCYDSAAFGVPSLMLCPTIQIGAKYSDWFTDLEIEGYLERKKMGYHILKDWILTVKKKTPRFQEYQNLEYWNDSIDWLKKEAGLL